MFIDISKEFRYFNFCDKILEKIPKKFSINFIEASLVRVQFVYTVISPIVS